MTVKRFILINIKIIKFVINVRFNDSNINLAALTNTVPQQAQKMQCLKIKRVDISLLITKAIRRIHNLESSEYNG